MSSLTVGLAASPAGQVGSGVNTDLIILIGVVLLVAVFGYLAMLRSRQRSQALSRFAAANGLQYEQQGDLSDTGIPLCERGHSRRWDRCISGTWRGTAFTYADYQYTVGEGRDQHTYRCSVVRMPLGCPLPVVEVAPRHLLQALFDRIQGDEVQLESIDFEKRYLVTSQDRSFAIELLDPRMMEAILGCGDDISMATGSEYLVVYGMPQCRPELLGQFLDEATTIRSHVPAVVLHAADGPPAP